MKDILKFYFYPSKYRIERIFEKTAKQKKILSIAMLLIIITFIVSWYTLIYNTPDWKFALELMWKPFWIWWSYILYQSIILELVIIMIVWFIANYGMKAMKKEDWFYIYMIIYMLQKFLFFLSILLLYMSFSYPGGVNDTWIIIAEFLDDKGYIYLWSIFLSLALIQSKLIDWWYVVRFLLGTMILWWLMLWLMFLSLWFILNTYIFSKEDYSASIENTDRRFENTKKRLKESLEKLSKSLEEDSGSWSVESKRKSSSLFDNSQNAEKLSTKFDYEDPFSNYSSKTKTEITEKNSSKTLDSEEETTIKNNSGTTEDEEKAKRAERIKEILKKKRAEKEKAENWN